MSELKSHRIMLDVRPEEPAAAPKQERDLARLARQLNAIAEELRYREPAGQAVRSSKAQNIATHFVPDRRTRECAQSDRFSSTARETLTPVTDIRQVRSLNVELAREAYAVRRRRNAIFGNAEIFGEPAWDILLDLYIAHVENKPVSVSSACIGSAAPPTTGLRWLGVLTEEGLILREHDPEDQRRVLVRLSDRGLAAMDQYFASAGLSA